jgi:hypothetical protein
VRWFGSDFLIGFFLVLGRFVVFFSIGLYENISTFSPGSCQDTFPNLEGKLDYTGFKSEDRSAIEWFRVMYSYYWDKASTVLPDQLMTPQK